LRFCQFSECQASRTNRKLPAETQNLLLKLSGDGSAGISNLLLTVRQIQIKGFK